MERRQTNLLKPDFTSLFLIVAILEFYRKSIKMIKKIYYQI